MDYFIQNNIGTAKYVLNFYDGIKKHSDGAAFYDIQIFKNKLNLAAKIKDLIAQGYKPKSAFN